MRRIVALASMLLAGLTCGGAQGQAPDLRDLYIIVSADWETEIARIGFNERPYRSQSPSQIAVSAVQGKIVWFGHSFGCNDPDRPGLSLVYARGNHAAEVNCPPFRSGTDNDWLERSAEASFRTRLDIKGNVLTLQGEMTGTYSSEALRCGVERRTIDGVFSIKQSLVVRLSGQTCEVISAHVVEQEDQTNEKSVREVTTRTFRSGPGFTCRVERRSDPKPPMGKLARMTMPC